MAGHLYMIMLHFTGWTPQKPPEITSNHQKASSKEGFLVATLVLWGSTGFWGGCFLRWFTSVS